MNLLDKGALQNKLRELTERAPECSENEEE